MSSNIAYQKLSNDEPDVNPFSESVSDDEPEPDRRPISPPDTSNFMSATLKIIAILLINVAVIITVFYSIPPLTEEESQHLKLPRNLTEAKILGNILHEHINQNYWRISLAHFLVIFFVHVASIPGASFLAILAGFLYPQYYALGMILIGSTTGCALCYLIVDSIGQIVIRKYLKEKVDSWRAEVDKNRDDLWSYFLFLRLTPFLPGWFINITSPLVKIPIKIFVLGTFFGISPQSYCFVLAGTQLDQLITVGDAFSWKSIIIWSVIATLSIVPVAIKKCFGSKYNGKDLNRATINNEFKMMQQVKRNQQGFELA